MRIFFIFALLFALLNVELSLAEEAGVDTGNQAVTEVDQPGFYATLIGRVRKVAEVDLSTSEIEKFSTQEFRQVDYGVCFAIGKQAGYAFMMDDLAATLKMKYSGEKIYQEKLREELIPLLEKLSQSAHSVRQAVDALNRFCQIRSNFNLEELTFIDSVNRIKGSLADLVSYSKQLGDIEIQIYEDQRLKGYVTPL